jgi:tRNA nucleotidyltransferase/poly(A) polymerase
VSPPAAGAPRLRPELATRTALVARVAAALGVEAYLVGGTVRDVLLGRDSPDLDFVTAGDCLALAAGVQRELGGRLVRHPAFLTAEVIDAGGFHLDFATARQETYRTMAALPEVRPAGIQEDLWRRDFTVNAMALPLAAAADGLADPGDPEDPEAPQDSGESLLGAIVDPGGGRRDLEAGVLRVLHRRSFLDDPTRVLRGVRFAARLGFRFAAETAALARQAVAAGAFELLSGSRLRREVELLLGAEPVPAVALPGLESLADLAALGVIHPRLELDAAARRRLQNAALEHAWYRAAGSPEPGVRPWLLLLMALLGGLAAAERREAARRLTLAGEEERLAAEATGVDGSVAAIAPLLADAARPSEVDAALAPLSGEELLLLSAEGGVRARSWVRRYWLEMRPLTSGVGGGDLLAAGAPRGREIGSALRATRAARLDGEIGPGEELTFALARLRQAKLTLAAALVCATVCGAGGAAAGTLTLSLKASASASASAAVSQSQAAAAAPLPDQGAPEASDRSHQVLRLDCASRLGRREVTLFGNGTIRLRDGPVGKEWMGLAELGPEEMRGMLKRLAEEDLDAGGTLSSGVAGDWIERCDLVIDLPGKARQRRSFGRYDTLPLGVSKVRRIAEELGGKVRSTNDTDRLPTGYEVRVGDVLKRADGNDYRVVSFTSDGKGVELDGLAQPLRLIVLREQLRLEFVALLSREP